MRQIEKKDAVVAYKAMNTDMTCRGYQYEVKKDYVHNGNVGLCEGGFHACEEPLDVFNYYGRQSRFFKVKMYGNFDKGDDKSVSSSIFIESEITFSDLFNNFFEKIKNICLNYAHANTAGDEAHANTAGYKAHANTAGNYAHANTAGDEAHANTAGDEAIAVAIGINSKAKVDFITGWIVLTNWIYDNNEWSIKEVITAKPGMEIYGKKIEICTWYWFEEGKLMSKKDA